MINKDAILEKIIKMFRPYGDGNFLDYEGAQTICGPADRAVIGSDTNFPKEWLVEDFGFTAEEAVWFIAKVRELAS